MSFLCGCVTFCTQDAWFAQQQAQAWGFSSIGGTPSNLFSFPVTSIRGGRQDFRETRGLIGWVDGNTLKVRSAWGIDRRPGPVPRWELCWRSFVGLKAICCEWREEYKEGGRAWIKDDLPYSQTTESKIIRPHCVRQFPQHCKLCGQFSSFLILFLSFLCFWKCYTHQSIKQTHTGFADITYQK